MLYLKLEWFHPNSTTTSSWVDCIWSSCGRRVPKPHPLSKCSNVPVFWCPSVLVSKKCTNWGSMNETHEQGGQTKRTHIMWCIPRSSYRGGAPRKTVKDESLGLVSVLRLKVSRLSVSSRSRTKFWNLSRLGLVSDENFWDSLVPVSSRLLQLYSVSSRSRSDLDE